jgi:hypothetical protein
MSDTLLLDFSAPVADVRQVGPTGEVLPPIAGKTAESRHASYTGARAVVEVWTARQSAYLQLLNNAGALSDHEAAALLKCGLYSVNSVRGALQDRALERTGKPMFVPDGYDVHTYTDESGVERTTKRTRWKIRRSRVAPERRVSSRAWPPTNHEEL